LKQAIINFSKKYIPHDVRMLLRRLNRKRLYTQQGFQGADLPGGVWCPVEEKDYRRFIKAGGDLLVPGNGLRRRQRLVWLYLTREVRILEIPMRVLHVAPEPPFMHILKDLPHLRYLAGDKMVAGYSDQKGVRDMDLTGLDLPDASFDLIICNHVLEHIPDDRAAMKEMYRVLVPGGQAVITVPIRMDRATHEDPSITSAAERRRHFGQWDHVRFYGADIRDRLEAAGFQAEVIPYAQRFDRAEYDRMGLCDDPIIVARRPLTR
jgi:hypothetical protein